MRNLLTPLTLAIAATSVISVSTHSAVFLNGQEIDSISITTNGSDDVIITTTGGPTDPTDPTGPTDPTDPTDPTGPTDPTDPTDPTGPTDPVDPTCGSLPDGVSLTAPIADWSAPGGELRLDLNNTGVISTEFTTTTGTSYGGKITITSTTGNSGIGRRVWISTCPGGPAIPDIRCDRQGTSITEVTWFQGSSNPSYCNITPSTRYYMNFQNLNCTNNQCDVTRRFFHNKRPF